MSGSVDVSLTETPSGISQSNTLTMQNPPIICTMNSNLVGCFKINIVHILPQYTSEYFCSSCSETLIKLNLAVFLTFDDLNAVKQVLSLIEICCGKKESG